KFVLVGREKLIAVKAEIRAIEKVGLAKAVREQKLQEGQALSEALLDAKVRIGQLMREIPKVSGGDRKSEKFKKDLMSEKIKTDSGVDFEKSPEISELKVLNSDGSDKRDVEQPITPEIITPLNEGTSETKKPSTSTKTKAEVIKEAGFTLKQAERFQQLAEHPELVERAKAEARENDDIVSRSLVLNMIKGEKRKTELQKQINELEQKAPEQPDGLFDVIVMDPPWAYGTSYDADGRRCANPYPEMTQEELKKIQLPAAENCVLFLWTTHKFIWDAKELLDTWKFEYRNILVWDKQVMGMGNLFRMRCEFCLVGLKGKPIFKNIHNLEDIIEEKRREHSRKPEGFYELVNQLCVGRKLDYFSRTEREGWEVYGNDTGKFRVA
ncbi:MAG: hypothetical protein IJU48_06915, partial [Synergistaceae bacterium]|nr:hypothetical protein [Synergistaceae bacterium]